MPLGSGQTQIKMEITADRKSIFKFYGIFFFIIILANSLDFVYRGKKNQFFWKFVKIG